MSKNTPAGRPFIYTIGHSKHSLDKFVSLLKEHSIEVMVDVRSHPYSRYAPHFNTQPLKAGVKAAGVKYLFLGKELGGRPEGLEFYNEEGYVLYWRVAKSSLFLEGISRLETGIQNYRVAIMCSEENPAECHRRLLVGRVLAERGVNVQHIRADGRAQTEVELARQDGSRSNSDTVQLSLFDVQEVPEWKSTRSVLLRKQQQNSSEP